MNLLSDIFPGPLIVLPLFIAIALMALLMVRYKLLIFLIIFTIPIRNVSLMEVPGANLRPGDLLILLGAGVVLYQILTGRIKACFGKLDGLLILFVVFCFISLIWAPDTEYGFARASKYLRNLILYMELLLWLRLDYRSVYKYIIVGMVFSFSYILYIFISAIVGGQLDISVLLFAEAFTSGSLSAWRGVEASQATFSGSINSLALWTAVAIILWFGTGLWMDKTGKIRWSFWGVMVVLFFLELATLSRSVWLGLVAGAAWCFVKINKAIRVSPRLLASAVILCIALALVLKSQRFLRVITGRFLSIKTPYADGTIMGRLDLWSNAVEIIRNHPILGLGIGLDGENSYFCVHNVYLQILTELGIFGFLLFLGIFGTAIVMLRRSMKSCVSANSYVLVISLMAGVIFYLITGLTMADFTEMEIWTVLAMISAFPYLQSGHYSINAAESRSDD